MLFRRQQGGKSVMCGVGFFGNTKGPIFFFDGTVNAKNYIKHMEKYLLPWWKELQIKPLTMQQDNAPSHIADLTTQAFSKWGINLLEWPAQSPDLNPVENLWKMISDQVYANGRQFFSVGELQKAIKFAYRKINPEKLWSLVNSMGKRLIEVIKKCGNSTQY